MTVLGKRAKLYIRDEHGDWKEPYEITDLNLKHKQEPGEVLDYQGMGAITLTGEGSFGPEAGEIFREWITEAHWKKLFRDHWSELLWTYWQMSAVAVCVSAYALETGAWELPDWKGRLPGYTIDF